MRNSYFLSRFYFLGKRVNAPFPTIKTRNTFKVESLKSQFIDSTLCNLHGNTVMMRRKERLSRNVAKNLTYSHIFSHKPFSFSSYYQREQVRRTQALFSCVAIVWKAMKKDVYQWRRALHIPVLIVLQVIFIILFGIFVVYDPKSAGLKDSSEDSSAYVGYPSRLLNK